MIQRLWKERSTKRLSYRFIEVALGAFALAKSSWWVCLINHQCTEHSRVIESAAKVGVKSRRELKQLGYENKRGCSRSPLKSALCETQRKGRKTSWEGRFPP